MSAVTIRLPMVLAQLREGRRDYAAAGGDIEAALRDLAAREPSLAMHFFDDGGALRRNLQFVHNETYVRVRDAATRALAPGDRVVVMNAVMGG
jgi:sulfur carrier protein ThiS